MRKSMLNIGDSIIYFKDSQVMKEVDDSTVALVVTSPPYFNYIEYGNIGIGTENKYEEYLNSIEIVFRQCYLKLIPDGKLCVNITNMKSRKAIEGESFLYSIVADYTKMLQKIGFTFFDEIIWVKADANNGALKGKPLFGSYPYPPNPKILDSIFENILIFKKEGKIKDRVTQEIKEQSKVSKEDWQTHTKGIWNLLPDRISDHPASFPIELPRRLIKIYSFRGELVLDPFVGTGTTVIAAETLGRKGIGYEIFEDYKRFILEKKEIYSQQNLF